MSSLRQLQTLEVYWEGVVWAELIPTVGGGTIAMYHKIRRAVDKEEIV